MTEVSISADQNQFSCPICLDLLNDPVTVPCGHSFCMACITNCWDQDNQSKNYACFQCGMTFNPKPVLHKNNMLAEVVEKLKATESKAASTADCPSGPVDVDCDFCTRTKFKATKSCLICLASFCETHVQPHYKVAGLKRHKLVKASNLLQERICSQHDKPMEIYCRTDQSCICYLCTMDEHKGHDTVTLAAERTEKQNHLKELQGKCQQRVQDKEKKTENVKRDINTIKSSAQAALKDSERIFTEMIRFLDKKRSEVTELIKDQEKAELSRVEGLSEKLEQEIADLKKREAELEQLSYTEDHVQFIQGFQSLYSGSEGNYSNEVYQHFSFNGVKKSLSNVKDRLENLCAEFLCTKQFKTIPQPATEGQMISLLEPKEPKIREDFSTVVAADIISNSEPQTRDEFLKYFCQMTLDPNTAHRHLDLSKKDRMVTQNGKVYSYTDNPERFDCWPQVLCKESISGRCYWEVEWSSREWFVFIAVTHKAIKRKGLGNECGFGHNNQSWSLLCSSMFSFWHNNIKSKIPGPSSSRIGVYVDYKAGILCFYRVSDTMTLLHRVQTTFNQPLCAGFRICSGTTVKLCNPK